jgi:hypothetical protein
VHAFAASSELRIWHEKLQARRSFRAVSSQFTALSLAVWYMDDGCLIEKTPNCHRATISFKRFRNNPVEAKAVSDMLSRFGIEHTLSPDIIASRRRVIRNTFDSLPELPLDIRHQDGVNHSVGDSFLAEAINDHCKLCRVKHRDLLVVGVCARDVFSCFCSYDLKTVRRLR